MIRTDILVFLLLFGSFAFFQHSEPGWNVNSRYALALAWAETGSPAVERYVSRPGMETEDLAAYNNHLYSDKSIGISLLAIPAVWLTKAIEEITETTLATATRRWIVTVFSAGIAGALSGVLLKRWLTQVWKKHPAYSSVWATCTSLAVCLGTMLFLYGTLLMSYLPATVCLLACLILVEKALESSRNGNKTLVWQAAGAGLFGGLTVLCEYTYAAAVGLISLYLATGLRGHFRRDILKTTAGFSLSGLLGIAPFLVYTVSIFGKPVIPYEYHVVPRFREAMQQGFMGAGAPSAHVLWLITFHPFRGVFVYSPLLLLGFTGLIKMLIQKGESRSVAALCLSTTAFYLLFNSAYYMWWGGWSFAPRHLAPAIPFMAVGILPWFTRLWGRWLIGLTAGAGIIVHTLVNATEPQPPDGGWQQALLNPHTALYNYPAIFLQDTWLRVRDQRFDTNLVTHWFPMGISSLIILFAWWTLAMVFILRKAKTPS